MFRDTFVEPDGAQPVIHEYRLTGAIDVRSRTVVSLAAHAGVLPGPDCVHAAAGVARLVGRTLDDVPRPRCAATSPAPSGAPT